MNELEGPRSSQANIVWPSNFFAGWANGQIAVEDKIALASPTHSFPVQSSKQQIGIITNTKASPFQSSKLITFTCEVSQSISSPADEHKHSFHFPFKFTSFSHQPPTSQAIPFSSPLLVR